LYFSIILAEIALIVYTVILIFLILKKEISGNYFSYLLLAYILSGLLSMISGGESIRDLPRMLPHLMVLIYFPINYFLKKQNETKLPQWLKWIFIFATLSAMVGIFYHFLGKERTTSTYGGYYTLANVMSWSLPISIALLIGSKKRHLFIYIVAIFIQFIALWWTYTRSAMLAVVGALGIWFIIWITKNILHRTRSFRQIILDGVIFLSLPLLLVIFTLTSKNPRINPLAKNQINNRENVDLTSGRESIMQDAYQVISQDWQKGQFKKVILGYGQHSRYRLVNNEFTSWESDYLQILMNQGIVGLAIILLLYLYFLKQILRGLLSNNHLLQGLAASGLTIFLMSFFTLKLTGWHSGAMFMIILAFLDNNQLGKNQIDKE
jgi:O-antigen ligase